AQSQEFAPANRSGFAGQANPLNFGKASGLTSKLLQEDSILFLKILDDRLLVAVYPAGDHEKEDLDLRIHPLQETLRLRAAQAPRPLRPDNLAIQVGALCRNGHCGFEQKDTRKPRMASNAAWTNRGHRSSDLF